MSTIVGADGLRAIDLIPRIEAKGADGQTLKDEKGNPILVPMNMTAKVAALDYVNKQLDMKAKELRPAQIQGEIANVQSQMAERSKDIEMKNLLLTKSMEINGQPMPVYLAKITAEVQEAQQRYEKMRKDMPNLDVMIQAIKSGRLDEASQQAMVSQMAQYLGYSTVSTSSGFWAWLHSMTGWNWTTPKDLTLTKQPSADEEAIYNKKVPVAPATKPAGSAVYRKP